MLFDGFTVIAQIVNFLILMWLLKRFLYQPVLDAIDAREQRIAKLLSEAESREQQAEVQQQALAEKNQHFAEQEAAMLADARARADQLEKRLQDEASESVSQQRNQWLTGLQKEQQHFDQMLAQRTQQEVLHLTRKVLRDLSDTTLDAQMVSAFCKQLEGLSEAERARFTQDELLIRTARPLPEVQRQQLQETLSSLLGRPVNMQFEQSPTLIAGIELNGNGHKLSWNIQDYVSGLEAQLGGLVAQKVKTHTTDLSEKPTAPKGEQYVG